MSSKLLRPRDAAQAQRLVWPSRRDPHAARPAESPGQSKAFEAAARDEDRAIDRAVAIEQARKSGYAAGEAAGIATGTARATELFRPAVASFTAMVQELAALRAQVRREAEGGTVDLAIAIARRVLHREIATDPEAIVGLVRCAMDRLNARETHRLRLAPSDVATVGEFRSKLNLPASLEMEADASLEPGSVIFETSRGQVDASIVTQLDEIQRGLTDVMRKRR